MSSTITEVPKDSTFKLPQGRFKAVIVQYTVKTVDKSRGKTEQATILFEVAVPGMENYECLARKVVPVDLKTGSCLRRLIEALFGCNFFKDKSNQAIDLRPLLVNQKCEVELIHAKHDEERYDFPLVEVEAVYPPIPETVKEVEPKN